MKKARNWAQLGLGKRERRSPLTKDLRSLGAEWVESRRERPGTSSSRSWQPMRRTSSLPVMAADLPSAIDVVDDDDDVADDDAAVDEAVVDDADTSAFRLRRRRKKETTSFNRGPRVEYL